ncbi:MAG: glycosyltransferase family 4 protein [Flavobacteriales bacterium]|nr:glycosyltransferase family 4 protein [Flavobacteriales bacterium]
MKEPLRILVVSDYRSTHTVRPEAEIFIRLLKKGHQVTVMTYAEAKYAQRFKEAGAQVINSHPNNKNDIDFRIELRKAIQEHDIQIVHFYNSKASVNGLRAVRGLKVKVCLYRGFTGHVHWYDPTLYMKYMHPRVNAIVCNSQGVANEFIKQPFIDKKRLKVIHKGHDLSWYAPIKPTSRQEFGLSKDTLLLVNVANNRKMKGIKYLLKAMNHLPTDADIKLLLVGREMDIDEHLAILEKGSNSDKVIFTGFRSDALSIVKMCDIFVLTSLWGESITKAVIEAMSLGIAPIISDIPGNRELAIDATSGLVVPRKDPKSTAKAIIRLYDDRHLLAQLKEGAKQHIRDHLNIEQTVEAYERMYYQLVN